MPCQFQVRRDGQLLSPSEELQVVVDHCNDLYKDAEMRRSRRYLHIPISIHIDEVACTCAHTFAQGRLFQLRGWSSVQIMRRCAGSKECEWLK